MNGIFLFRKKGRTRSTGDRADGEGARGERGESDMPDVKSAKGGDSRGARAGARVGRGKASGRGGEAGANVIVLGIELSTTGNISGPPGSILNLFGTLDSQKAHVRFLLNLLQLFQVHLTPYLFQLLFLRKMKLEEF